MIPCFSSTITFAPIDAAWMAAAIPAPPAPITTMSQVVSVYSASSFQTPFDASIAIPIAVSIPREVNVAPLMASIPSTVCFCRTASIICCSAGCANLDSDWLMMRIAVIMWFLTSIASLIIPLLPSPSPSNSPSCIIASCSSVSRCRLSQDATIIILSSNAII